MCIFGLINDVSLVVTGVMIPNIPSEEIAMKLAIIGMLDIMLAKVVWLGGRHFKTFFAPYPFTAEIPRWFQVLEKYKH